MGKNEQRRKRHKEREKQRRRDLEALSARTVTIIMPPSSQQVRVISKQCWSYAQALQSVAEASDVEVFEDGTTPDTLIAALRVLSMGCERASNQIAQREEHGLYLGPKDDQNKWIESVLKDSTQSKQ